MDTDKATIETIVKNLIESGMEDILRDKCMKSQPISMNLT